LARIPAGYAAATGDRDPGRRTEAPLRRADTEILASVNPTISAAASTAAPVTEVERLGSALQVMR
jgi:hypothetical protein